MESYNGDAMQDVGLGISNMVKQAQVNRIYIGIGGEG